MRNFKKVIFILLTFVFSSVLAHPAGSTDVLKKNPSSSRQLAAVLLDKVFDSYLIYTRGNFGEIVSNDFVPSGTDLLNNLGTSTAGNNTLEIEYFLNNVIPSENKLFLSFKWLKKSVPFSTGNITLTEGEAEFVFKREDTGWKLYQIKGDNPF
ncbi:MAG: hypothetical protein HQL29_02720 [Candidatus Omnitrophica bacterium]|nr:hypothetical protein [Candidatus Omnitrophota bacterium]